MVDPNVPCNEDTRNAESWVECPPGSGKPARKVKPCNTPDDPLYTKNIEDAISTPFIQTIAYALANTEQKITIPKEAKRFSLKFDRGGRWQFSFVATESNSNFDTIGTGGSYKESGLCLTTDLDIYVYAAKAGRNFILRYWT